MLLTYSRYFSANYAILIALLGVYSLISNVLLLFSMAFLIGGFLAIGRFVPEPFEIAGRTITPQNLYIGLFVIGTSESYYERQVRGRCNGSVRGAKHREAQWSCSAQLSAVLFAETARSVRTCERGSAMIIKHLCRRDRERALT